MYAYTKLALGKDEALVIPYQSVQKLTGSNERYIYVNDNGVARRVFVKLGDRYDDKIEISSDDLNPGDEIVVTGAEKLVDGVTLKIER
jgi:multidrug efflux pump subunit AcrA (membrane-fusion protein)